MATKSEWMKPAGYGIRDPLDTKRHKGRIVNPPRLNEMGGLDKLHEPYGHYKNDMTIKKPGGTK
jgi:hypothetical protein